MFLRVCKSFYLYFSELHKIILDFSILNLPLKLFYIDFTFKYACETILSFG